MRVEVLIGLKNGVLDPQGSAVLTALHGMGFESAQNVRVGKWITLEIDAKNAQDAKAKADSMCKALLVNGVIETYRLESA